MMQRELMASSKAAEKGRVKQIKKKESEREREVDRRLMDDVIYHRALFHLINCIHSSGFLLLLLLFVLLLTAKRALMQNNFTSRSEIF